jgi:glycosyltransferase involved in cell wall biosynthesis
LVLLGDGPLKPELERLVAELKLQDSVVMPGFKQYDELPFFYALAGAFIHASTVEQWGLVVNEAMASGLPVLVSNRCGCAQDLVKDGVNGFNFDPYHPEQMAELMFRLSAPQFPLADFGAASRRIITDWSPERFAKGFCQSIESALGAPRPKMGALDRILLQLLSRK